jgi:hypothetical protein
MSGIFLTVWDDTNKDLSPVLRTTKGGYPHVTVAYTGKELSIASLKEVGAQIFSKWCLEIIFLVRAEVNSFEDRPGHIRNDVLLILSVENQAEIEETREVFLRKKFANHRNFFMRTPHVTYGIYEERGEAEKVAQELNAKHLPRSVVVTGVTID